MCEPWDKAFFALVLATVLRRGEFQTLHWGDRDLAHGRVHVRAKPQYRFLPKDWEERVVPFSQEAANILREHKRVDLNGKAFIPLLSAYACAVPAIMAGRTKIENKRDRLATILIAPFVTCSARLGQNSVAGKGHQLSTI